MRRPRSAGGRALKGVSTQGGRFAIEEAEDDRADKVPDLAEAADLAVEEPEADLRGFGEAALGGACQLGEGGLGEDRRGLEARGLEERRGLAPVLGPELGALAGAGLDIPTTNHALHQSVSFPQEVSKYGGFSSIMT
jgi:hypothetical protein